jgi:hypothetical protein
MATNNVLDAVLSQYENSKSPDYSSGTKMSQEDRMKKYFAAILTYPTYTGRFITI